MTTHPPPREQRIAAPQGHEEAFSIHRFRTESSRLLGVLDEQLAKARFVCGDNLTIVDIACYPYARSYFWAGVDVTPYVHLRRWLDDLDGRESFQRGITVPMANREFFGEGDVSAAVEANAKRFAVPETGGEGAKGEA